MARTFAGKLSDGVGRYAAVVARYNESLTSKLLDGAVQTLVEHGVDADAIDVARVPGAWEIPLAARRLAESGRYDAILCFGVVIRGETTHDRQINRAVSLGLAEVSLAARIPVLFGVLSCNTREQAIDRCGGKVGNKGTECSEAALEMVALLKNLDKIEETIRT